MLSVAIICSCLCYSVLVYVICDNVLLLLLWLRYIMLIYVILCYFMLFYVIDVILFYLMSICVTLVLCLCSFMIGLRYVHVMFMLWYDIYVFNVALECDMLCYFMLPYVILCLCSLY